MVSCESYGKPACASLPVIVAGEDDVVMSANDVNTLVDCSERPEVGLDTGNFVKRSGIECEHDDRSEAVSCNSLGERLEELVVEPLSNLDISSQASRSGNGSSGNDSYLVNDVCTLKGDNGNLMGSYQIAMEGLIGDVKDASVASTERNSEQTYGRLDLTTGCVEGAIDRGNVSVIECVLNRIPFHEIQCKGEIDGPKHDEPATSIIMLDKSTPEIAVAAHKFHRTVKSFDREANDGNSSAKIESNLSDFTSLESPLSLRRSSRSRKTVQTVQSGTNGIKVSKKASKLTVSRTIDLLPHATRKKRSFLCRSVCSSGWGLSKRFSSYFELSKEVSEKQVLDEGKPELKAGQRCGNGSTVKVVASSQLVEDKQALQSRRIRLKVTFGKKEDHKAVSFLPGIDDHISIPVSDTQNTVGNKIVDPAPEETSTFVKCSSSTSDVQFTGINLDICSMSGKSSHCDSLKLPKPEKLGNSYAGMLLDPGTSPDSEVIDSSVGQSLLLNNSEKNMSSSVSIPLSLRCPASSKSSKNKRNKKDNLFRIDNAGIECQHSSQKVEVSKKDDTWQKSNDNFCTDGNNAPSENPSSNTSGSGSELVSMELLSVTDEGFQKAPSLDNVADSNLPRRMIGIESADSGNSPHLCTPPETQRNRNLKGSKAKAKLKNQSKIKNAKRNQKESSGQKKSNKKLSSKHEVSETTLMDEAHQDRGQPVSGNFGLVAVENTTSSTRLAPQHLSCLDLPPNAAGEQSLPPRVAWVCCDECEKWRCISAKLADVIEETNGKWTCKDNQDQTFADCSVPQEKSNAEINAELQLSDEEDGRHGYLGSDTGCSRPPGDPQQSTWMVIKSNLFLHRRRKTQTMDEVMVCHCKPPSDGSLGCGSQCLNRMLNIECVHGTCPCGDLCSNQLFQQRSYANLSWFRSGRKGYGLQVLEDIFEGKFLIEYVGEVLDLQSYEARQKEYALKGHKHFYFMTLNGNEVIDASSKGNLGRFVNHSCDPNCRTEKWVVNGEICVGLFALRNIRKGEELTFDYNYVRVFGAAAKKCYCGSLKCRGYIGGDPLNSEIVVQGDSDDEFPEPIAINENGELEQSLVKNMVIRPLSQDVKPDILPDVSIEEAIEECSSDFISQTTNVAVIDEVCESTNEVVALEADKEKNELVVDLQELRSEPDYFIRSSPSSKLDVLPIESSLSKPFPSLVDSTEKMSEVVITEGERPLSKARPRMKISRPSKSMKNKKSNSISTCDEKALLLAQPLRSHVLPCKPKKLVEGPANGHLEGVEAKLNELLDADGGICKKKDASKGYLKLLLLTAASGDSSNGGAIQSNRELSLILGAFLKTKSRGVLLDIISKNGLQMLHNMMKLYRKDFKKTPILRKLLKVLEFLAEKEILTVDRIIGDSLRPGVESFRESILNLTEHEDKKVHQIARNFRDKWIPRPLRNRYNVMDNMDRKREFNRSSNCTRFSGPLYHPRREQETRMSEPVENMKQSSSVNNSSDSRIPEASSQLINFQTIMNRPRKRKSRWDQPTETASPKRCKEQRIDPFTPDKIKTSLKPEASNVRKRVIREEKDGNKTDDVMEDSEDDVPPGFSCLQNDEHAPPGFSASLPHVVSVGQLQERYDPRKPVAYGIPFSIIQQFGTDESQEVDSWAIAPAFPFKPFPPLPPHPRDKKGHLLWDSHLQGDTQVGPSLSHVPNLGPTNQDTSNHGRGSWNGPGRRYQKQKNLRPPWLRNLDNRGFKANHHRNRVFDRNMETKAYQQNGQHLADVNQNVECAGNSW